MAQAAANKRTAHPRCWIRFHIAARCYSHCLFVWPRICRSRTRQRCVKRWVSAPRAGLSGLLGRVLIRRPARWADALDKADVKCSEWANSRRLMWTTPWPQIQLTCCTRTMTGFIFESPHMCLWFCWVLHLLQALTVRVWCLSVGLGVCLFMTRPSTGGATSRINQSCKTSPLIWRNICGAMKEVNCHHWYFNILKTCRWRVSLLLCWLAFIWVHFN